MGGIWCWEGGCERGKWSLVLLGWIWGDRGGGDGKRLRMVGLIMCWEVWIGG